MALPRTQLTDNQRNALQVLQHGYAPLWRSCAGDVAYDAITDRRVATTIIGAILRTVQESEGGLWPWKYWTKQSVCAHALYESGGRVEDAMRSLTPVLGTIKALRFQRNADGKRVDLTPEEQQEALRKQLLAMRDDVLRKLGEEPPTAEQPTPPNTPEEEPEPQPEPEPEIHPWLAFIRDTRGFLAARQADGHPIDTWGLRPAEYGALMLKVGIPVGALKHAATMHFPREARNALGVLDYDVMAFRPEERLDGMHAALPYVMALVKAGVPTALIGDKGTGKTTLGKQVAEQLFGPDPSKFVVISMTSATSPSAFYGRPKIGGDGDVVESLFSIICRKGGLILLDEMDAADENLLLIANSAIANRVFYNQQTGKMIHVHPDTIFMAGMNTMGLGAGRDYNARNKLDAASLDRWAMGRVRIGLDERVEDAIFYGILNS